MRPHMPGLLVFQGKSSFADYLPEERQKGLVMHQSIPAAPSPPLPSLPENAFTTFFFWAQLEMTHALLYAVLTVIITPLNHCPYFCKD